VAADSTALGVHWAKRFRFDPETLKERKR
jgi:hypothetical protein